MELFLHGVEVIQIENGVRPIRTVDSSIIGIVGTAPDADNDAFPENTPVLVKGPLQAGELGDAGTLKDAYEAIYSQGVSTAVIVRVAEGADAAATLANVVGDATAQTGVWALETAGPTLDRVPRILVAPGFTTTAAVGVNAVVTNLLTIAEKLRAVVIADGPNTTEEDAIAARANYGSDRLFIIDPAVTVFDTVSATDVARPASPFVAGIISRLDVERGFWWSPSNQIVNGITGTTRPVSFNLSSRETAANRMNDAEVATIIRKNGFRIWGNRSTTADAQWAFLSVRRTADVIYESIELAHQWAMDRPMSAQLFEDIRDGVQAFGQALVNQGGLLGFNAWIDPELNTETSLKSGRLYLDFDFEPPAPLEHLVFRAHRNDDYYQELIEQVSAAA